jgi:hypothetical protein
MATKVAHVQDPSPAGSPIRPFCLESYGVRVKIGGNDQALIDEAAKVANLSLLGNVEKIDGAQFDHVFELIRTRSGTYRLNQNDSYLASGRSRRKFLKFFDSIIRVSVGEYAVDRVFLHAGVVGWKGKAIVMPADSFQGKSTLVAELVRQGADYYSDEFAVLDAEGAVHPFARPISLRTRDAHVKPYEVRVEDLGGRAASSPIPVGMVLLTGYTEGARWRPKILSAGNGLMEIMPFALSIRQRPEFSLKVLHNVATRAIIASGRRGSAELFARTLLKFVDKHVD